MNKLYSLLEHIRGKLNASAYLRDVLWQASGNTFAQVIGIAALPFLTRLYSPSDFASLNLFSQVVAGLAIVMTLRFEYLVMLPSSEQESEAVMRLTVRMGSLHVLLWTPLLLMLPSSWSWLASKEALAQWLWLAPITAWGISVAVAFQQLVQRRGDFRTTAWAEFVGRCSYVGIALLGALALPSIMGLMAATAANAAGKLVFMWRNHAQFVLSMFSSPNVHIAASVRRMALSTSLSNIVSLFSGMAPMVFIADQYGASALGQYGLVISTLYLPSTLLGQAIGQVYYQRACRLHADKTNFSKLLVETTRNLSLIGLPLYGLVALISPFAYPLAFGSDWRGAGELAPWMCLAAAAGFLSNPLDRTSMVVNAWWYLSTWNLIRALATFAVLLISHFLVLSMGKFIALLALLVSGMYLIDLMASYYFANSSRHSI